MDRTRDTTGLFTGMGRNLRRASDFPWRLLGASVVVGGLAGLAGVGYHKLTDLVQHAALQSAEGPATALEALPWWWVLVLPALGGLLIGPIVFRWVPETRGTGTPEVMKAVAVDQGRIRGRVAPWKLIASSLTVGTGGSVGREGPIIQIGAALGSKAGQLMKWPTEDVVNLVGAGAAAGIAAMFNAPIAGAFFALEVILRNFAAKSFAPIVLASVTATAVSRAYLGNFPAFRVPEYALVSGWEIPIYLVLGLLAGLVGVAFIVGLDRILTLFRRLPVHDFAKPALGGLGVGACVLLSPAVYGTGFEAVTEILVDGMALTPLLMLLPMKLLATSLTTGSGGSGGIFSPSLFIGAIVGALFGQFANMLFPGVVGPPGAYALVGMGAVLSGITHAPIASILMLFEITSDYQIILPLMVASTTATLFSSVVNRESFYTLKLVRLGVKPRMQREEELMQKYRVEDIMRPGGRTVAPGVGIDQLVTEFLASRVNERYVVSDEGIYEGFISLHDIKEVLNEEELSGLVVAEDIAHRDVSEVSPHMTLGECMEQFVASGHDRLPVVSEATGHFLGTISEHDVIGLYNRELLRDDFLGTIDIQHHDRAQRNIIQIPHDYTVRPVPIPDHLVGKTLMEAQLRAHYHLTVLSIQDPDGSGRDEVPNPERPLSAGIHLVVVGRKDDIAAFLAGEEPGYV